MKVLYITNSIGMGGASVAIINMLTFLIHKGITPLVTCPSEGSFSNELKKMNIPVQIIGNPLEIYPKLYSWRSYIKYPYSLFKLLFDKYLSYKRLCACIEKFQPQLIHTNVGPIHIGYIAAKKYKLPHIWHIREYQKEDFKMHPFPSMKTYIRMLHDKDNHCISITKGIFSHFDLDIAKDIVIYDGVVDKHEIRPLNTHKQPYILFAGRLSDAKGIKDLIATYNIYAKNNGKFELYIAGKGNNDYIQECLALLNESVKDKVHFLGECKHEDIYQLMHNASIFVVPSRNEGFGFITAEAMFNGTIVIGRNTGGTKEQFDNGKELTGYEIGFRYETNNELLDLLSKCSDITPNECNRMLINAQTIVCQLYDMKTQADKVFDFYLKELS